MIVTVITASTGKVAVTSQAVSRKLVDRLGGALLVGTPSDPLAEAVTATRYRAYAAEPSKQGWTLTFSRLKFPRYLDYRGTQVRIHPEDAVPFTVCLRETTTII